MTHHTSVKKKTPGLQTHSHEISTKTTDMRTRASGCLQGRTSILIQHTEVHTIVRITLAFCSDCHTRIIVCALLNIRVPEYHCATPLDSKNLAAENTILLKTISIVMLTLAPTMCAHL